MNKKNITSIELAAIIEGLQFLVQGTISQIYHQENEFLFQLHAKGEGKQLLKIIPGKYLCLTKSKNVPLKPSSFCMQLRKYLDHALITKIYQKDSERIIVFELEKTEKYNLIIELFSKGNLILTNNEFKIIAALEQRVWKDRTIKIKEKYLFPFTGIDWKKMSEKELTEILSKSEKNNLAVALATEVGLGGIYAEEVCKLNDIDKEKSPVEITEKEIKLILKSIHSFMELIKSPQGYIYQDQITPFPLSGEKEVQKTASYSEALDTLNPFKATSPYEKKINALLKMISQQEESVQKMELEIILNSKKGELIYEKYPPLQKLWNYLREAKSHNKSWKEIEAELSKVKKIKKVDLKNKKVIIDL